MKKPRDRTRSRRLRVRLAAAGVAALLALLAAGETLGLSAWRTAVAAVAATPPSGEVTTSVLPFRYRGRTRFITVSVSAAEIAAARALPTAVVFARPAGVRDAYLRALVSAQARSRVLADVARQLRATRDELGLDADEYVELAAAAVQDMPYGTPRAAFQLPVETLARGRGVCVDRSILLAALLVREGYDAGLWTLSTDNHVAVAVRGIGEGYRGSGYVYLEATERAYVGEVPDEYAGFDGWEPSPRLIAAGSGRAYRADIETAVLVEERRRAEDLARQLVPYAAYAAASGDRWRASYLADARRALDASSLAAQLAASVDDRSLAFATLLALGPPPGSGGS